MKTPKEAIEILKQMKSRIICASEMNQKYFENEIIEAIEVIRYLEAVRIDSLSEVCKIQEQSINGSIFEKQILHLHRILSGLVPVTARKGCSPVTDNPEEDAFYEQAESQASGLNDKSSHAEAVTHK